MKSVVENKIRSPENLEKLVIFYGHSFLLSIVSLLLVTLNTKTQTLHATSLLYHTFLPKSFRFRNFRQIFKVRSFI